MPFPKGFKFERKPEKHGLSNHKLYKVWSAMKDRCTNKKCRHYQNYGGRGIGFSDEWKSFSQFFDDMAPSYKEGLTLERVDNDGDYTKENCMWVPRSVQLRNKRNCVYFTLDGITKTQTDWANEIGISYQSLRKRLRNGWSLRRALTTKKTI